MCSDEKRSEKNSGRKDSMESVWIISPCACRPYFCLKIELDYSLIETTGFALKQICKFKSKMEKAQHFEKWFIFAIQRLRKKLIKETACIGFVGTCCLFE